MERIDVTDPGDPRIRDFTDLTDVRLRSAREPAEGLFMAESVEVIGRALAAGYRPRAVLTGERWLPLVQEILAGHADVPVYVGTDEVVAATTGYRMHRGPMASMQRRTLVPAADVLAAARTVLVLAGLVDHTNVGAAFRSGAALGVDAVVVTPDCADPLYRRSVRVSMGTVFQVPWTRLTGLDDLAGFTLVALTPDPAAMDIRDVAEGERVALLVGTEGPGLSDELLTAADLRVRIPMAAGVDSLNVAAAVAVACYALTTPSTEGAT